MKKASKPLIWTKKLPSEAGRYWYRREGGHDIALVYMDGVRLVVYRAGSAESIPVAEFGNGVEWAGPIPMPEEPVLDCSRKAAGKR